MFNMKLNIGFVLSLLLLLFVFHGSLIAQVPSFDTDSYCEKVGEAIGGSSQIELSCREIEQTAKSKLITESYSNKAMNYCKQIAETVGGSYHILLTCIQDEMSAERKLR
jgi:hypothetical protein